MNETNREVDEAMVERGMDAAIRQSFADLGHTGHFDWRAELTPAEIADFRANTRAILEAALAPTGEDK